MDGIRYIPAVNGLDAADSLRQSRESNRGASFGDALTNALGALEQTQVAADVESTRLAEGAGNLHETTLALEKADVSLRLAVKVRNKLVEAYQEVMRLGV